MNRPLQQGADQLSFLGSVDAGTTDSVDQVVSAEQPAKPTTPRQRQRRPRGTGAVFEKGNRWYGQWYLRGKVVKRSLGPMRQAGSRDGLTRTQAEARLRELMLETNAAPPPVAGRMTVAEVGDRRIKQLARSGRKPDTTLANYESEIRIHFAPHFGETTVDEINADDVEDFIDACLDAEDRIDRGLAELSVKTVRNLYVHLNGIFEFAISKGWAHANPCRAVDKPASPEDDETEIRFLDQAELDALLAAATTPVCRHTPATLARAAQARTLRDVECLEWQQVGERLGCSAATAIYLYRATPEAVLDNDLARVDRALYLTAAMTGLRQGELLGLRGGTWTGPRAGRGLGRAKGARRAALRQRQVPDAQVADLVASGPDGRSRRPRAGAAVPGLRLPGRRRSRVWAPTHRPPTRTQPGEQAVQADPKAGRRPRGPFPRI